MKRISHIRRTIVIALGLPLVLISPSGAAYKLDDSVSIPVEAAQTVEVAPPVATPNELIAGVMYDLERFVAKGGAADPAALTRFLDDAVAPVFDFPGLARFAAGRLRGRMTEAQLDSLARGIRTQFLSALARNLGGHIDPMPTVTLREVPAGYSGQAQVRAYVNQPDSPAAALNFRLYESERGWKVFDVTADGNSAATYYRALVQREWRRGRLETLMR